MLSFLREALKTAKSRVLIMTSYRQIKRLDKKIDFLCNEIELDKLYLINNRLGAFDRLKYAFHRYFGAAAVVGAVVVFGGSIHLGDKLYDTLVGENVDKAIVGSAAEVERTVEVGSNELLGVGQDATVRREIEDRGKRCDRRQHIPK